MKFRNFGTIIIEKLKNEVKRLNNNCYGFTEN